MPAPPVLLRRARPAAVLLTACVLASGLLACTGERPHLSDEAQTTTTATSTTEAAEPTGPEVAEANDPSIDVYASEDAPQAERQIASGVDTSLETIPVVFLVKSREPDADRMEVYLPVPPNGSTGWVDAADVTVRTTPYRIELQISEHRLRVFRDDEEIVIVPAGVGPSDRPTPGSYFLRELLEPPDPEGPFGAYTYGLSGSANVLESLEGGAGLLAIHGTDQPDTVGEDVESGSISLTNDVIARLVEEIGLPLGTPVEVTA